MTNTIKHLYHATYGPNIKSIMKYGLIPNIEEKIWEDSDDYVYLANDPYVAESYAETALDENENLPEELYDDIVILEIDTSGLDLDKLYSDSNVIDGDSTFQYEDVIDPKYIHIYES